MNSWMDGHINGWDGWVDEVGVTLLGNTNTHKNCKTASCLILITYGNENKNRAAVTAGISRPDLQRFPDVDLLSHAELQAVKSCMRKLVPAVWLSSALEHDEPFMVITLQTALRYDVLGLERRCEKTFLHTVPLVTLYLHIGEAQRCFCCKTSAGFPGKNRSAVDMKECQWTVEPGTWKHFRAPVLSLQPSCPQ